MSWWVQSDGGSFDYGGETYTLPQGLWEVKVKGSGTVEDLANHVKAKLQNVTVHESEPSTSHGQPSVVDEPEAQPEDDSVLGLLKKVRRKKA